MMEWGWKGDAGADSDSIGEELDVEVGSQSADPCRVANTQGAKPAGGAHTRVAARDFALSKCQNAPMQ